LPCELREQLARVGRFRKRAHERREHLLGPGGIAVVLRTPERTPVLRNLAGRNRVRDDSVAACCFTH
jgi:hypothetical protein